MDKLTVASAHAAVVVGHGDEVITTWAGVWIDQELRHVQVSAGKKTSMRQYERKL